MSDDTRSTHTKQPQKRIRILVVQNPNSDEEGSSGDEQKGESQYPEFVAGGSTSHAPPPLTTDLPAQHFYSSSRSNPSNPALSSPSTASSPAAESTPPPSTPNQTVAPVDLSGSSIAHDAAGLPVLDRHDGTARALPNPRIEHARRHSNNRLPSQLHSPTLVAPHDAEASPNSASRSTPTKRVNFLVTRDADMFTTVDITGAITPAFIKERIFTKLGIDDEEQFHCAIYRTEIGSYAIGDALSEEQLFQLYREQGDSTASVKLLVCPSSAPVHLPPDPACTSPVVGRTVPPPVLPQYITTPLNVRRHRSSSRRGSQSSASEHQAPGGGGGYDASVSDDLEFDSRRSTIRPQAPSRIPTSSTNRNISPAQYRPHSPLNGPGDRPSLPDPAPSRPDIHSVASTGLTVTPVQSPQSISGYGYSQRFGAPSLSYDTIERDRATQVLEQSLREQHLREQRRRPEREAERPAGERRVRSRKPNIASPEIRQDTWQMVDHPTTSPDRGRGGPVSPGYQVPAPPRVAAPVPGSSQTSQGKRNHGKQVPTNVVARWRTQAQSPTHAHRAPKSYSDLKSAARDQGPPSRYADNRHPDSLQPGRIRPSQGSIPTVPRLSNGGYTFPSMDAVHSGTPSGPLGSAFQDSSYSELGIPRSYDGSRGMVPPIAYQSSGSGSSIRFSPGSSGNVGTMSSISSQTTSRRPRSAEGDPGSNLPGQQRSYPQRGIENGDAMQSHVHTHSSPSIPLINTRPEPLQTRIRVDAQLSATLEPPSSGDRSRHSSPHSPTRIPRSTNTSREGSSRPLAPESAAAEQSRRAFGDSGSSLSGDLWPGFIDENETEGTVRPCAQTDAPKSQLPPSLQSYVDACSSGSRRDQEPHTLTPNHLPGLAPVGTMNTMLSNIRFAPHDPDDDHESEEEEDEGTIWAKRPALAKNKVPPVQNRPPLPPLSIENSPSGNSAQLPSQSTSDRDISARQVDAVHPRPQRRNPSAASVSHNQGQRVSRFEENQSSWASRPPAEVVLDQLEQYFPQHDLDKPVIETQSGGTSPTAAENPMRSPNAYGRKKSIRHVAVEHRQRVDRASRMESSGQLRKRNTRLWGHKLEEVTTEQEQARSLSTSEASPGGAPKPIFRWVRGELIGKGTYGKVYLALNATTGEMIAVKQVEIPRTASDKDDERQVSVVEALKLESETLKDLDHPNIVQYLGFEETANFLSIFLEYVPGGSIASCLRRYGKFEENVTKSFMEQILAGLEYLHSKGILHRDLKADNILVEQNGICKISDFGISKRTEDVNEQAAYTSMQGTVFWMAPEVIGGKKGYNSKIDIWSVGCVVFEMWTGQRPWSGQEAVAVLVKLYQFPQGPPLPDDIILSPLADDFRRRCFAMDPDDRPTAAELRKHKYLELPPWWQFEGFHQ